MKLFDYSGKYSANPQNRINSNDPKPGQTPRKSRKPRSKTLWVVLCCVILACVACACLLVRAIGDKDGLSADATNATVPSTAATTVPVETTAPTETTVPEETTVPTETEIQEETVPPVTEIMPKFKELYERNPEFYGWLTIGGTKIDYPVMQCLYDNEKYLHADFDGNYSYAGIPYIDMKCSPDSDNLLVYGHNMKDGTMFRTLFNYEQEEFWQKHPTFTFSDLYEDYEYEVMAVFYDKIYKQSDTCFKFYFFIDAKDEADFDYAVSELKKKSIYDTGVTAQYGDQLITLITCAYHVDDGRFVVVARRK